MKKLAEAEKKHCAKRVAFQTNLTVEVKSMLTEFSKTRRELARIASEERRALLLEIRKQVAGLRTLTSQVQAGAPRALAVPLAVPAPKIKIFGASIIVQKAKTDSGIVPLLPSVNTPKMPVFVAPVQVKVEPPRAEMIAPPALPKPAPVKVAKVVEPRMVEPRAKPVAPPVASRPLKKEAHDGWLDEIFGKSATSATKAKRKKMR